MDGAALVDVAAVLSQSTDFEAFLGDDLLPWLVLAVGAALAVGTLLALLRPPPGGTDRGGVPRRGRPPLGRSLVMMAVGVVAAAWGAASLLSG